MKKAYQCPTCGEIDLMVSVEEEIHNYEIHPDEEGDKCYTGYSDCVDGRIDFIMCKGCASDFPESRLPEMVIDLEEEE